MLEASIPANTTAAVYIPAAEGRKVTESGRPLSESAGVLGVEQGEGYVVVNVDSGTYHFIARAK